MEINVSNCLYHTWNWTWIYFHFLYQYVWYIYKPLLEGWLNWDVGMRAYIIHPVHLLLEGIMTGNNFVFEKNMLLYIWWSIGLLAINVGITKKLTIFFLYDCSLILRKAHNKSENKKQILNLIYILPEIIYSFQIL